LQNIPRRQAIILFSALYMAQGLPFGFFTLAVPTLMRDAGMSLKAIGATGLLTLPWSFKFLWAPYLDHRGTPKQWLLRLQSAAVTSAALLACLGFLDDSYWPLIVGAFVFNLVAASQDVVTDGLAVRTLGARDLGMANALQVGAYRFGMILGGGVLLRVFAATDWTTTFLCMAALLAITMVPVMRLQTQAAFVSTQQWTARQLATQWLHRLLMPGSLMLLGLIFCYRLGDAMISNLLGPFMVDQGLTKVEIADLKGTAGSLSSLIGALLGGVIAFRVQRRTLLLVAGIAQAASFVPYLVAAAGFGSRGLLWTATIAEGLIGTIATVALFTLMMDASDPEHAGTDYTLFASAVVAINTIGGLLGGVLGDALGFAGLFAIAIALCVLGCVTLVWQLDRSPLSPRVARAWGRAPMAATAD
jgi:MFS family permease